jgi:hypothetical protein
MKRISALIVFVIALISIASVVEMPQSATGASASKNASNQEEETLRSQVLQFLSTWLVNRDFAVAINSFGANAFSNEAIFDDYCFWRDVDQNSTEAIKKDIELFLKSIEDDDFPVFDDLTAALNLENLVPFKPLKSKAVNPVDKDRFLLMRVKSSDIVNLTDKSKKKSRDFLKKFFKESRSLYLSIIPIGDDSGVVFFIWEKDGEFWKISHAIFPFCP